MAVVHTTFSFQTENPPGTIQNYQGDLVEGRDYPDGEPFSVNEQNEWTVVAATGIDKGDPLTDPFGWWDWWETHYIDTAALLVWGRSQVPTGPPVLEEPPHINKIGGLPDRPSGVPNQIDQLYDLELESRKKVNEVIDAVRDIYDRIRARGTATQLFRTLFAIEQFKPNDPGYREFVNSPPTMTWDELRSLGLPRAERRTDLRPELVP